MNKIRNIDISTCNAEQAAAYNFCLRFYDVYLAQKGNREKVIDLLLLPLKHYKSLDYNAVSDYVHRNIERYAIREKHIFTSYQEIGNFFK